MLNFHRFFLVLAFTNFFLWSSHGHKQQHEHEHNYGHNNDQDEFPSEFEHDKDISGEDSSHTNPIDGQPDWCQFNNGTKIPFGFTFLHTACTICECTKSRKIRCSLLQCLPAYCIDDTMPTRLEGQCCAQCKYEQPGSSCNYKNLSFPHGVVLRSVERKMQCWCQMGHIECRNYLGTIFDGLNILADGTIIYMIVIIFGAFLVIGLLTCCACTLFIYNFYQKNQGELQNAYDQYVNEAGWQPVDEVEVDQEGLNKEEEAAMGQQDEDFILDEAAPPYTPPNKSSAEEKN